MHRKHLGSWLNAVSKPAGLGCRPRFRISNELAGEAGTTGLWTTVRVARCQTTLLELLPLALELARYLICTSHPPHFTCPLSLSPYRLCRSPSDLPPGYFLKGVHSPCLTWSSHHPREGGRHDPHQKNRSEEAAQGLIAKC